MSKSRLRAADGSRLLHLLTTDVAITDAVGAPHHIIELPVAGLYLLEWKNRCEPVGTASLTARVRMSAFTAAPSASAWSRRPFWRWQSASTFPSTTVPSAANPGSPLPAAAGAGQNISFAAVAGGTRNQLHYKNWVTVPGPCTLAVWYVTTSVNQTANMRAGSFIRASLV